MCAACYSQRLFFFYIGHIIKSGTFIDFVVQVRPLAILTRENQWNPSHFLCRPCAPSLAMSQLSTLGSVQEVGEKLSKGRKVELLMARERVTEGIRLYVSASIAEQFARLLPPSHMPTIWRGLDMFLRHIAYCCQS